MTHNIQTAEIRQKLHQLIDDMDDTKAAAMYTLFEDEIDTDIQRHKIVQRARARYFSGEGKSYDWEQVKKMTTNKQYRDGI